MLKNYFTIAWRKLKKNKLYSLVNIIGLTSGLAACLLIGVYLKNELTFDDFHKNADRIVRATMEYSVSGVPQTAAFTGTKVGPHLKREFPEIAEQVRTMKSDGVFMKDGQPFSENNVLYADPAFFKVFSFRLLSGNANDALNAPDKVVLSATAAKKYFNSTDVVGKTLQTSKKIFRVAAVAEDAPNNSQIHFDFVLPFQLITRDRAEEWFTANYVTYLLLKSPADIKPLQDRVKTYMAGISRGELAMKGSDYLTINLQPLKKVHLYSKLAGYEPNGNIVYIYILFTVALLTLVIAAVNYTNLSIAQSTGRSGEISIRKVLGAGQKQLFRQFLGESLFYGVMAAILALFAAYALLPQFNNIAGTAFTTTELFDPLLLVCLLILTVAISFIAGVYPSALLANMGLAKLLKSGFSFGGNTSVRRSLIVFQFVISFFLIIATVTIVNQLKYVRSKDLGYNRSNMIGLPVDWTNYDKVGSLKTLMKNIPGVQNVTVANSSPVNVRWTDKITTPEGKQISVKCIPADENYLSSFKLKLASGANFTMADKALMDTSNNNKNFKYTFIINETAARELGYTPAQAIGKIITKGADGIIKGVVKDFNFQSLHDPISPLIIFLDYNNADNIFLQFSGSHTQDVIAQAEKIWKQQINNRPFQYSFVDEDYNALYKSEQHTSAIFKTFSFLAILLACLGLFALTAFSVLNRTKEIGIRKVLGASVTNITLMLSQNFLKLVLIAIVIASPIAWYAMNRWLQDFAYRVTMHWYIFAAAALVTITIAFITVGFQSVKAAVSTPVKSLRND